MNANLHGRKWYPAIKRTRSYYGFSGLYKLAKHHNQHKRRQATTNKTQTATKTQSQHNIEKASAKSKFSRVCMWQWAHSTEIQLSHNCRAVAVQLPLSCRTVAALGRRHLRVEKINFKSWTSLFLPENVAPQCGNCAATERQLNGNCTTTVFPCCGPIATCTHARILISPKLFQCFVAIGFLLPSVFCLFWLASVFPQRQPHAVTTLTLLSPGL